MRPATGSTWGRTRTSTTCSAWRPGARTCPASGSCQPRACWTPVRRRACWSTGPWWTAWWRRPAAPTSPAACRTTAATRRSRPTTRQRPPTRPAGSGSGPSTWPATRPATSGPCGSSRGASPASASLRPPHDRPGRSHASSGRARPGRGGRPEPGRDLRGRMRRGVARRRRHPGQPDGPDPHPGRPARAAHLLPRPAAHRRRGPSPGPGRRGRRRPRHRGLAALPLSLHHGGRRPPPRDDGRGADRPVRQPEHLLHRRLGPAQGPIARGARRARQHHQPPGQLLGAPALPPGLRRAGGHGLRHRLRPRGRPRPAGRPLPRAARGRHQPRDLRLPDPGPRHAAPLGPPRRHGRRRHRGHRVPAGHPRRRAGHPAAHRAGADPDPRPARSGRAARTGAHVIRTRLTELLGIACPIVQAAMGYVSGARLAAAVSQAGGLGLIASATMSAAELRSAIKEVQDRTGAPFGVNLRADAPDARERAEMIIAERVPVASFALAPRPELISMLRDAGVVTIASVGARRHAEKVAAWGIDAVIATGAEGGGHTGAVPTSLLVPQVVDAVDIPVIAAGGFFDGRGLAAALAYGAAGIAMGTRFLLTSDSPVPRAVKDRYLAASVADTLVTDALDGVPQRLLRTPFTDYLARRGVARLVRSVRSAAEF